MAANNIDFLYTITCLFTIKFGGQSRIRTYNVYPEGTNLQSVATPPSLPSTQILAVRVGFEPTADVSTDAHLKWYT